MNGITFGTKHSYNNWGIILEDTSITPPQPKRYVVDVPARNGLLDLTAELTPNIRYANRTIAYKFRVKAGGWDDLLSGIYADIHGRTMDVKSDWDPNWHWHGFVTVNSFSSDKRTGVLVINVDADPFKLANTQTSVSRSGNGTLSCTCDRMEVTPTITNTTQATIVFGDVSVTLAAGTHIVNEFIFTSGTNTLTITSTGTTTVKYTNGRL